MGTENKIEIDQFGRILNYNNEPDKRKLIQSLGKVLLELKGFSKCPRCGLSIQAGDYVYEHGLSYNLGFFRKFARKINNNESYFDQPDCILKIRCLNCNNLIETFFKRSDTKYFETELKRRGLI